MKCKILPSGKKKIISKCSLLKFFSRVLKIKKMCISVSSRSIMSQALFSLKKNTHTHKKKKKHKQLTYIFQNVFAAVTTGTLRVR